MTDPVTPATDEEVERLRFDSTGERPIRTIYIPAEVRRLIARIDAERAALTESEAVRDRMRALLDAVAVAVRGPPAPNILHDHARLPDEVAEMRAERAARERAEEDAQHAREESTSAFDATATHLARAERAEAELAAVVEAMHGPTMQTPAERVRAYVEGCEQTNTTLGAVVQWTNQYGAHLRPDLRYADTYGDGVRWAKASVRDIINGVTSEVLRG